MAEAKKKREHERPAEPWTTPGTDQPEKRPGPFAHDPSRTPPPKEQRKRNGEKEPDGEKEQDDEMDAVMRDTPL